LIASSARIFVSSICSSKNWPCSLEKAHSANHGVDRHSSAATNGGSDGSESDALYSRIASRCNHIFRLFPDIACSQLTTYATDIFHAFVVRGATFNTATLDYDRLFSSNSKSSSDNSQSPWHDDLSFSDQYRPSSSAWFTEVQSTTRTTTTTTTGESGRSSGSTTATATTANKSKYGPSPAAIFSRIVSAISFIIYDYTIFSSSTTNTFFKNILLNTLQSFDDIYTWCTNEINNVNQVYQTGKRKNLIRPQKTTLTTFSSNNVILDFFRSGQSKIFNASSSENQTLIFIASSLCTLSKTYMKSNIYRHDLRNNNHSSYVEPSYFYQSNYWNTNESLQRIAEAHWSVLRGEPALKVMNLSSLNVSFDIKENEVQNTILNSRGNIFTGRGGNTAEHVVDLRVERKNLIPTSMRELIKMMSTHDFPFFRRKISTLRVNFAGEQGSGPGVSRGWFSSVTFAIQSFDNRILQKIGGGLTSPLAPTYMERNLDHYDDFVHDRAKKLIIEMCAFVGRFIGLAISNGEKIPLTLCPHVVRYLMGQSCQLIYLRTIDIDLYNQLISLLKIKETNPDVISTMELTFNVGCPNGKRILSYNSINISWP
jgi:hypothetical protein